MKTRAAVAVEAAKPLEIMDVDIFLKEGLRPWLLDDECKDKNINLKLRMHPNYDHSYYFISTFMSDHLIWHRDRI